LLLKLAEKQAAWYVAYIINDNFDKMPGNVRNELLLKLTENKRTARYATADDLSVPVGMNLSLIVGRVVPRVVAANFDKLPDNVRNLLFNLAEDKEAAVYVARAVAENFDKLPENVRNELRQKLF
jgi:hypothetical protein